MAHGAQLQIINQIWYLYTSPEMTAVQWRLLLSIEPASQKYTLYPTARLDVISLCIWGELP